MADRVSDVAPALPDQTGSAGATVVSRARRRYSLLTRGDKLVVFKFRRRKNYVRRNGHRQDLTAVKIADIQA